MPSQLMNAQIPAAGTYTTDAVTGFGKVTSATIQYRFTAGSGGTSVKAYVQTSLDGGVSWWDIACEALTTSDINTYQAVNIDTVSTPVALTDGSLTDNTAIDGLLGDRFRVKYVVVGTYSDASLIVDIATRI